MKNPIRLLSLFALCGVLGTGTIRAAEVLIVADEFPAMEVLAAKLKSEENIASKLVKQTELPADLSPFAAVLVYIHKQLDEPTELACIKYAEAGGRLILLHHSISSGKRKNKEWFKFLGVTLPQAGSDQEAYKYAEGITMDLVNLAPEHFITSHQVTFPDQIDWKLSGSDAAEKRLPGVTLHETEVYLNHVLSGPRTVLLGLKYTEAKSGKLYMQAHAGWVKPAGKGQVVYLMAGHSSRDFENPVYGRLVLNAVIWKP